MTLQDNIDPLILMIFGASGDLARRKLIPAIFDLHQRGELSEHFAVLGVSRSPLSDDDFRKKVFFENEFLDLKSIPGNVQAAFAERLFYQPIDTSSVDDYALVRNRLQSLDAEFQTAGNVIFYLSTPPFLYDVIPQYLAHVGLNHHEGSYRRLVIEKPFGSNLASARLLNQSLKLHFDEESIYRIDHYLGKESVQNLLVTRFANSVFEPLWNRNYVEHIEITNAEDIGVGSRGGYYDQTGALRDMLQNHLLQVIAHVAMEPPIGPDARSIRNEKTKLFESLRPISESNVVHQAIRGQYIAASMNGERVQGYRDEDGVPKNSTTETYAAIKFFVDNWRWSGVPFYARTGKRLPTKVTEVTITFKKPPHSLFRRQPDEFCTENNKLVVRIQPDEGMLLNFGMKVPGDGFHVEDVGMDFHYSELADNNVPTAYERLLLDCMRGDATLYAHGDSVEYAWEFVEPIINAWEHDTTIPIYGYPAGSWGPDVADQLFELTDACWRNPCRQLTSDTSFCLL